MANMAPEPSPAPSRPDAPTLAGPVGTSPLAVRPTELAGVRVGPFEIKGLIGSGGFGDVYLGEQREPVERMAAVKMLAPERCGTRCREQFDAERRLLARIDHPNVARMLDAGTTPDGRDWVAMEYVPGLPIVAYCDQNRLDIAERVELLESVARAVDFAHEKGVVHRDLKPGNILVTVDGGLAVPKIIDFGIARVLGEMPQASEPGRSVGTPGYMAPEQLVSGGADADARADVYALGAVMYELCTGTLPLEHPDERARATAEQLAERARTESAPPMSERVARMGALADRIAADRRTDPHHLERTLRGDLNWIAARCLDRDRMRRYLRAGELADDLRRWRQRRPIEAAPAGVLYRARKFTQRNTVAVVLVSALAVATLAGLAGSIAGWQTASRERDDLALLQERAAREALEARSAVAYISSLLGAASVNRAPDGAALTVEELLRAAARTADAELANRPATDALVRLALGRTCASLGMLDEAQVQLIRARSLAEKAYGSRSAETAEALEAIAQVALLRGNPVAARTLLQEAAEVYGDLPGDNHLELARNAMQEAEVEIEADQPAAALARLDRAAQLALLAGTLGTDLTGSLDWYRSLAELEQGRYQQALQAIERNLAINRSSLPADHWWIAESETVRAAALAGLGRAAEGLEVMRAALPALERALPPGAPTLRKAYARAAFVAGRAGDQAAAARWQALAQPPAPAVPPQPPGTPGRSGTTQGPP